MYHNKKFATNIKDLISGMAEMRITQKNQKRNKIKTV